MEEGEHECQGQICSSDFLAILVQSLGFLRDRQGQVVCHKHIQHIIVGKEQANSNKISHSDMGRIRNTHSPWSLRNLNYLCSETIWGKFLDYPPGLLVLGRNSLIYCLL